MREEGPHRLGVGGKLPPLLLDDEEAVAVAVGLRAATGISGVEESSARALTKLRQVLPTRLRRQVTALRDATTAIRDHQGLRCLYQDTRLELEPYRMIAWQRRWYLVARDRSTGDWAPYRVDWLSLRTPGGARFEPQPFPGDMTEFVVREVARTGWAVHARLVIDASADEVLARINPAVGTVEPLDDGRSVLVTGADSLEMVAVWIGLLGLDFTVQDPPELVGHLRILAERYSRAIATPA